MKCDEAERESEREKKREGGGGKSSGQPTELLWLSASAPTQSEHLNLHLLVQLVKPKGANSVASVHFVVVDWRRLVNNLLHLIVFAANYSIP